MKFRVKLSKEKPVKIPWHSQLQSDLPKPFFQTHSSRNKQKQRRKKDVTTKQQTHQEEGKEKYVCLKKKEKIAYLQRNSWKLEKLYENLAKLNMNFFSEDMWYLEYIFFFK